MEISHVFVLKNENDKDDKDDKDDKARNILQEANVKVVNICKPSWMSKFFASWELTKQWQEAVQYLNTHTKQGKQLFYHNGYQATWDIPICMEGKLPGQETYLVGLQELKWVTSESTIPGQPGQSMPVQPGMQGIDAFTTVLTRKECKVSQERKVSRESQNHHSRFR